uniref:Uncharacterized protein n=1 Tax=Anopheles gambiae TaxID=7165 RepID=A0A0E4GBP2_ANOGA
MPACITAYMHLNERKHGTRFEGRSVSRPSATGNKNGTMTPPASEPVDTRDGPIVCYPTLTPGNHGNMETCRSIWPKCSRDMVFSGSICASRASRRPRTASGALASQRMPGTSSSNVLDLHQSVKNCSAREGRTQ